MALNKTYKRVSFNFEAAKAVSILVVITGHYFGYYGKTAYGWVLVTIALFIFGFSSGYFTSEGYPPGSSLGQYWKNKYTRLLPRICIINFFLLILFLFRKEDGVFSWQTIVHFFGGTGFLNWFSIPDGSPFGNGLWFLTLLLLFYAVYPIVRNWQKLYCNHFTLVLFYCLIIFLHKTYPMGHMLWLTVFAFFFGIYCNRNDVSSWQIFFVIVFILTILSLAILNMYRIKSYNFFGLSVMGVSISVFLLNIDLHCIVFARNFFKVINSIMLEMYLVHTYLFSHYFANGFVDFCLSMLLTVIVSLLLNKLYILVK